MIFFIRNPIRTATDLAIFLMAIYATLGMVGGFMNEDYKVYFDPKYAASVLIRAIGHLGQSVEYGTGNAPDKVYESDRPLPEHLQDTKKAVTDSVSAQIRDAQSRVESRSQQSGQSNQPSQSSKSSSPSVSQTYACPIISDSKEDQVIKPRTTNLPRTLVDAVISSNPSLDEAQKRLNNPNCKIKEDEREVWIWSMENNRRLIAIAPNPKSKATFTIQGQNNE